MEFSFSVVVGDSLYHPLGATELLCHEMYQVDQLSIVVKPDSETIRRATDQQVVFRLKTRLPLLMLEEPRRFFQSGHQGSQNGKF